MIYDTLKMAQRLEGPFTRDQALALTEALAGEASETIATKADLVDVRGEIAALRAEMIEGRAALETRITTVESNLIKWIAGALVLNLFGTAGLIVTLTKALAR